MKKIIFFIAFLNCLTTLGQSEFSSNSNGSKLSDATFSQIKQRLKDYEIVDFDHKSLDKYLKKSNQSVKIKLGKNISGTWNFEENEMRASYVGKSKYDNDGNLLNGVELAETYAVKSSSNPNTNIRLFVSPNLISGFIHDGDSFIRIESLAYFLKSQNSECEGKVIIYEDKNAIVTNEIKCGVTAKQTNSTTSVLSSARVAANSCNRLMSIAVETDADFVENINSVMQEVDYILNLNFKIKVEYYHKPWSANQAGYPYSSSFCPFIATGQPGAGRIEEGVVFGRFQNAGWIVNNLPGYDMYHFITGRKMYASGNGNTGGYALSIPICGTNKPLSISTTEFSGTQQVARTMCHELGHNLSGNPNHDTNCNSCPNNPIMCTFVSGTPSQGCRGLYFSTNSVTQIEAKLTQSSSCLSTIPAPIINAVYLSGNVINSTPYFTNIRNGNMSISVTQPFPFYSTQANFSPSNSAVSVSGNPNTIVLVNVPNSVNSYSMNISASNPCGTVFRSVPISYGSGFKLYPNPATSYAYIEFDVDVNNANNDVFLPQTISLKNEKNEVVKKNQPKQDYVDKKLEDGKRLKWDISTLPAGVYYLDVIYSEKNTSTVRLLIQK